LENTREAIEEFEKEYWQNIEEINQQKREEEIFRQGELPRRFTVKKLFGWMDKRYNEEYWGRLKRN